MVNLSLTKDDAIFFMDMVGSVWGPNFKPKLHKSKPYIKILRHKDSAEYKRFIDVYEVMKYILTEKEIVILNEVYGIDKEKSTLQAVADSLNLSFERVRVLRNGAENKIAKALLKLFDY
ncbi:hypothetical protein ACIQXV_24525 [Neobacillus sp. NPDC097160]|uniref:hypothetical protein n=1 Tax=Neobacillus sp. NPDC097160 TaxID=3364298 RepID=UPI00381A065A